MVSHLNSSACPAHSPSTHFSLPNFALLSHWTYPYFVEPLYLSYVRPLRDLTLPRPPSKPNPAHMPSIRPLKLPVELLQNIIQTFILGDYERDYLEFSALIDTNRSVLTPISSWWRTLAVGHPQSLATIFLYYRTTTCTFVNWIQVLPDVNHVT